LLAPSLTPVTTAPSPLAPAPAVSALVSGRAEQRRGCSELVPLPGTTMTVALTLPSGGVTIRDQGGAPALLSLRRFGDSFQAIAGAVAPSAWVALALPPDAAAIAWQLQVTSSAYLSVCGLEP
jgi:hypothetical protein